MGNEITKNVIVRIRAETSPQTASEFAKLGQQAQRASADVRQAETSISKAGGQSRTASDLVSSFLSDTKKNSQTTSRHVDDLSRSFSKMGAAAKEGSKELGSMHSIAQQIMKTLGSSVGGLAGSAGGMLGAAGSIAGPVALFMKATRKAAEYGEHLREVQLRNREMREHPGRFTEMEMAEQAPTGYAAVPGGEWWWDTGHKIGKIMHSPKVYEAEQQKKWIESGQAATAEREERRAREISVLAPIREQQLALRRADAASESENRNREIARREALEYRARGHEFGTQFANMQQRAALGAGQAPQLGQGSLLFRGVGGLQLQEQAESIGRFSEGAGEHLAAARSNTRQADDAHKFELANLVAQKREMQELLRLRQDNLKSDTEIKYQASLIEQSTNRVLQTHERLKQSKRDEADAQKDINRQMRDMVETQRRSIRAVRVAEEEKIKDKTSAFTLMDPFRQQQVLNVARKVKAGGGAGRPPQWRMVNGRPQMVPGTATGLTEEEMGIGQQWMPEAMRQMGLNRAKQNPMVEQLLKDVPELTQRRDEAAGVEKALGTVKTEIGATVDFDQKRMQEIANTITQKISGIVRDAVQNLEEGINIKMRTAEFEMLAHRRMGQ